MLTFYIHTDMARQYFKVMNRKVSVTANWNVVFEDREKGLICIWTGRRNNVEQDVW